MINKKRLPVVIIADLIAETDQSGWNVFIYTATPEAWGQDMEVPDNMLYLTRLLSLELNVSETIGEYAAKISVPGAVISGCNRTQI